MSLSDLWSRRPVVSVVRLHGVIGQVGPRHGLTLDSLAEPLEKAFKGRHVAEVVLAINSPGGSPVQSSRLHDRIRHLATKYDKKVTAIIDDVAASGGYWLACAADDIQADPSSVVGSIGVIAASFGFHRVIDRLGVERRVYTAGDHKAILDPFQPEKADDVARLQALQADVHESFKDLVRHRRGLRLKGPEEELFSGAFWTGRQARELGLVDGLESLRPLMESRHGDKVRLKVVNPPKRKRRLLGLGSLAGDMAGDLAAVAEERAWWGRYGL